MFATGALSGAFASVHSGKGDDDQSGFGYRANYHIRLPECKWVEFGLLRRTRAARRGRSRDLKARLVAAGAPCRRVVDVRRQFDIARRGEATSASVQDRRMLSGPCVIVERVERSLDGRLYRRQLSQESLATL